MPDATYVTRSREVPSSALIPFLCLTFAITWGVVGSYVLAPDWSAATFGAISGTHPFFFLATWAPALAAFTVVTVYTGWGGLKRFLSRLLIWRASWGWAGFVLIVLPLVFFFGAIWKAGGAMPPRPTEGLGALVFVLGIMLFLGPVEEFGWRGLAQPILQRHLAPLWARALIGVIWGLWHLPAFFLAGTVFAGWSFLPFFVGNITLAILVTPLFNSARGSLLWPMAFHWQLINPFWPDAQPYDTWILVGVTVVVVWRNQKSLLSRGVGVTRVVPAIGGEVAS